MKQMKAIIHTIWEDEMGGRHYAYDPEHPDGIRASICVEVELMGCQFRSGELAAEYWRAEHDVLEAKEYSTVEGWFSDAGENYLSDGAALAWRDTIRRFAFTPEYDREDWPDSRGNRW